MSSTTKTRDSPSARRTPDCARRPRPFVASRDQPHHPAWRLIVISQGATATGEISWPQPILNLTSSPADAQRWGFPQGSALALGSRPKRVTSSWRPRWIRGMRGISRRSRYVTRRTPPGSGAVCSSPTGAAGGRGRSLHAGAAHGLGNDESQHQDANDRDDGEDSQALHGRLLGGDATRDVRASACRSRLSACAGASQ